MHSYKTNHMLSRNHRQGRPIQKFLNFNHTIEQNDFDFCDISKVAGANQTC